MCSLCKLSLYLDVLFSRRVQNKIKPVLGREEISVTKVERREGVRLHHNFIIRFKVIQKSTHARFDCLEFPYCTKGEVALVF